VFYRLNKKHVNKKVVFKLCRSAVSNIYDKACYIYSKYIEIFESPSGEYVVFKRAGRYNKGNDISEVTL